MTRENNPRRISSIGRNAIPSKPVRVTRNASSGSSKNTVDKQVETVKNLPKDRIAANAAEKQVTELTVKLQEAVTENRKLMVTAESAKKEVEQLRQAAVSAQREAAKAGAEVESGNRLRLEAENKVKDLQAEVEKLHTQLAEAVNKDPLQSLKQVKQDQITDMIAEFEETLSGSLSGLMVQNVELKLKVTVQPAGNDKLRMYPVINGIDIQDREISEFVIRMIPSLR